METPNKACKELKCIRIADRGLDQLSDIVSHFIFILEHIHYRECFETVIRLSWFIFWFCCGELHVGRPYGCS